MLNLCQVPLNACGINTTSAAEAQESDIWDFVVARLASMRVNSCSAQFKECLQSEDMCGEDYSQCIGLDTDTIMRMCPYDTLVGCQQVYGDNEIRGDAVYEELYSIAQGIFLNIDNNMLEQCQKAVDESMIRVCGDTEDCTNLTIDENIGSRSLEYKICEYTNSADGLDINYSMCRNNISQIMDSELGRVTDGSTAGELGAVTPFAGVIDGIIYWDSVEIGEDGRLISVDQYLENIGDTNADAETRDKLSSELAVLQSNIDAAINTIEADPQVQYCMTGRTVEGVGGRSVVDRSNTTTGRFPQLTQQVRMIIANAALKAAKDNYYAKYDELTDKMMDDYVTLGERLSEIEGENALDARRDLARQACVNFAELSSLPKSPNPPKSSFGKILSAVAIAGAAVAIPFTGGLSSFAIAGVMSGVSAGVGVAAAGAAIAGIGLLGNAGSGDANGADTSGQLQLAGSKSLNQWNYKETITTTFDWETLVCHKCTRTQQCSKTKNPLFGNKYCKTWADPVETCNDIQF